MIDLKEKKGPVIFVVLLALVIIGSIIAFLMTGSMGIEERFNHAIGLSPDIKEEDEGLFGFSLEGDPILYVVILCALGIACFVLYRHTKM
jgi:hypothetical protein